LFGKFERHRSAGGNLRAAATTWVAISPTAWVEMGIGVGVGSACPPGRLHAKAAAAKDKMANTSKSLFLRLIVINCLLNFPVWLSRVE
jgi:hypothetical protein